MISCDKPTAFDVSHKWKVELLVGLKDHLFIQFQAADYCSWWSDFYHLMNNASFNFSYCQNLNLFQKSAEHVVVKKYFLLFSDVLIVNLVYLEILKSSFKMGKHNEFIWH